jgi:hypothetical protein
MKLIVSETQDGYIPSGQKRFFAGHGISCSAQISSQTSRPLAAQLRHEISLGAMGAPFRPLVLVRPHPTKLKPRREYKRRRPKLRRRACGLEDPARAQFISGTVHSAGYRFVACDGREEKIGFHPEAQALFTV